MKKIISILMAAVTCFSLTGCQKEEKVDKITVERSFIAGYVIGGEEEGSEPDASCRVLMNLMSDGTAEFYVGTIENGQHSTTQYSGTYTLGENEEFDETISFNYTYGDKTAEINETVIVDSIFESEFYLLGEMTPKAICFYETTPAAMDGDVYVGYLTKTGGMGAMVYAYSLCIREDNTFDVSIMQLASVMHVWGGTSGTYTANGDKLTFTYDVLSTEGEVVTPDFASEGKNYTDTTLSVGFNISQSNMIASDAPFIRVK